jgi:hypothetical protein
MNASSFHRRFVTHGFGISFEPLILHPALSQQTILGHSSYDAYIVFIIDPPELEEATPEPLMEFYGKPCILYGHKSIAVRFLRVHRIFIGFHGNADMVFYGMPMSPKLRLP